MADTVNMALAEAVLELDSLSELPDALIRARVDEPIESDVREGIREAGPQRSAPTKAQPAPGRSSSYRCTSCS